MRLISLFRHFAFCAFVQFSRLRIGESFGIKTARVQIFHGSKNEENPRFFLILPLDRSRDRATQFDHPLKYVQKRIIRKSTRVEKSR